MALLSAGLFAASLPRFMAAQLPEEETLAEQKISEDMLR